MSNQYEIEIKSLLGSPEKATKLKEKIREKGGVLVDSNKQLNHYFIIKNPDRFKEKLSPHIVKRDQISFKKILEEGSNFSVRTRDTNGKVILVVKASIGSDTSANGVSRLEFESEMKMALDDLDKLLLDAGLKYQAKWSREREEYKLKDVNICLDKNAGYGYLAEFEKIVKDRSLAGAIKDELLKIMREFRVQELPQDRLERMFAHYNSNWRDYYGTEKIFNIK
ncbi:MAG: CYTH domain-containing protein [bacterium]|nr:CYTH domain-containing protein [bacterium]